MAALRRALIASPLATLRGRVVLAALFAIVFVLSFKAFEAYYTEYPLPLLAGIAMAAVMYLPTLVALWFFDRREREPWPLVLFTVLSVIFFFGPVTSRSLGFIDQFFPSLWVVGFVEEFWKIAPLMLLLGFLPRAVGSTRDGLIYGALGGFGFAVLEFAANTSYDYFPEAGWGAFVNGIGRFNLIGTHSHVLWAATIGASIGWAASAGSGWKRYAVPLATYLAIALLHIFEDRGGNILSTMLGGALLEPLLHQLPDAEAFAQRHTVPILLWFGTVNVLLINVIVLPVLFVVLRRSGDTERRIIREQLARESDVVITRAELDGVNADRRWRTRSIDGLPRATARRIVQWQNELALLKAWLSRRTGDPDADAGVQALRRLIAGERSRPQPSGAARR